MGFCPRCGAEGTGNYCTRCGAAMNGNRANTPGSDFVLDSRVNHSNNEFTSRNKEISRSGINSQPSRRYSREVSRSSTFINADPRSYKLGFHKFLVYFWLWVIALADISDVGGYLELFNIPGASFDVVTAAIFVIMGVISLGMAVFIIYARFQIARFKRGAIKKLLTAYTLEICSSLVSYIVTYCIISPSKELILAAFFAAIFVIVIQLLILIAIWRYYSSREELFVR